MKKILRREMNRPLSEDNIRSIVGKCHILEYSDLKGVRDISEVCQPQKPLVLLFEQSEGYGHWTCVLDRDDGTYEFFDSYGFAPDEELKWTAERQRLKLGVDHPYLSDLLSGHEVIYNNVDLQGKTTSTCGRWVCVRILLKKYQLWDFIKAFITDTEWSGDQLVTLMTMLKVLPNEL